jgi:hypothetical protein
MAQSGSKISQTISIELIGGPLDGHVDIQNAPFECVVERESPFRSDIKYIYKFDEDPKNNQFPLIFRFLGYKHT